MKTDKYKSSKKNHQHRNYFTESSGTVDVVCGANIEGRADIKKSEHSGKIYNFCGDDCRKRFEENPEKYSLGPILRLDNIDKIFQMGQAETRVLSGMSINIWEGDFIALVGSSGSGKSTTLNMMGLLDKQTAGKIYLRGIDISLVNDEEKALLRSETFGFVFQQYNLIPWLTAYENIILPRIFANKRVEPQEIIDRATEVGLGDRLTHRPFEMSGGEQQRVALWRALVNDPKIILADEPTGNLDSITGKKILEMLVDANKKNGKTLVIVTHDHSIAERADKIITLKDGRVEASEGAKYYV